VHFLVAALIYTLCITELKYTKKIPDKQQNSLTIPWHSSQNRMPWHSCDFPESGNPGTFSEAFYKHYPISETKW